MTIYAGEIIKIIHTASLEGTALDNTDVNSVDIIIYNSDQTVQTARTPMTWDATNSRWYYNWDTDNGGSPLSAGSYRTKVILVNIDTTEVWEWGRIRLAANPI